MTTTLPRAVQSAARLDPRTDAELLARFLAARDQPAFAALVQRHGPLVYGVCRRALGPTADADDAFQATFLVLVKRAAAIPWRANLGPWLFGVAHRVASKARFHRDRRFAVEKQVDAMPQPEASSIDPAEADDLSRAFDEELAALPEEMRRAVVVCELQGLSRQAATKQLRIREGTLSSRLGRARKKLAAALAKRGFTLAIPAAVGVSVTLAGATVRAATDPTGAVPAGVAYLVQEALKAMTISKLKLGMVLSAVAVGCTWVALAADPKPALPPAAKAEPPKVETVPDVVATVNGQDVTKDEFADYLIQKYGAKEIELFVNTKVIEQAATKAGVCVSVSEKELDAVCDATLKKVNMTRSEFARVVLSTSGQTEADWRQQAQQALLLGRLCHDQLTVSETEVKEAFETKYGERRVYDLLEPTLEQGDAILKRVRALIEEGETDTERIARLCGARGATGANVAQALKWVVGRYPYDPEERRMADALFAGKVTGRFVEVGRSEGATDQRVVFVKLVEILPPVKGKTFENEKAALRAEVERAKAEAAIPKLFAELKAKAKPVYHIQPEPKSQPQPSPRK